MSGQASPDLLLRGSDQRMRFAGRHPHGVDVFGVVGQAHVDMHRAALLRQARHLHHARAQPVDLRRLLRQPVVLAVLPLVLVAVLVAEPAAHLRAAAAAGQVAETRAEPVTARLRVAARDDLDLVAVLHVVGKRHDPAIDLGTAGAMPDLGMYRISKIDRCTALRQIDHPTFGRKHIDTVMEHLRTEILHQFFIVGL